MSWADCIEHEGAKNADGYGQARREGKLWLAHRLAWQQVHGSCPPLLRHKCDNPACVNVQHLEPGTQVDNMQDCLQRGRFCSGQDKANASLTQQQADHIRSVYIPRHPEYGTRALSRSLGIGQGVISRVVRGASYKGEGSCHGQ